MLLSRIRCFLMALGGGVLLIPHFAGAQSLPDPPTGVSGDLDSTCPLALITWNASLGATFYQVYVESAYPPWTGGGLLYSGSALRTKYRYQYGQPYQFGVAACNASGCSQISTIFAGVSPTECP
jgi:hypothetical protein